MRISFKKQKPTLAEFFNFIFFVNLFNCDENSAIIEDRILTKKNNRKTFDEIFSTKKEENERKIADFID